MKITLLNDTSLRLEPVAGPLTIESVDANQAYSAFHMLGGALGFCTFSVLHTWAQSAKLDATDLTLEVSWTFAENPHRVGTMALRFNWPSLPESRLTAAKRVAERCTVHATLHHPPAIAIDVSGSRPTASAAPPLPPRSDH